MTWQSPEKRSRSVHFHLWASEEEAELIRERMALSGITGFGAFARKMLIDGYHVAIDLADVREMVRLLKNATDNINQIARRVNETRSIYAGEVEQLRREYTALWESVRKILTSLAEIK
ncbi:MAG: MobC family plasmid mobilization relaxosome protein [Oscillospiraceae bacterium]|jgi:hypothetical protein|nr:MobC family plasmid mobilization relaxosome protein [Oscillospiraceae bacterium]